uniref:Putative secreted protein n=1 Tax=Ixodes ricinus TaxID=34613 RepID=V5IBB6_IXORI
MSGRNGDMFVTLAVAALFALQAAAEPPEDPKCQYAWASLGTSGGDLRIHDGKPGQGAVAWGSFQNDIHFSGKAKGSSCETQMPMVVQEDQERKKKKRRREKDSLNTSRRRRKGTKYK